MTEWVEVAAVHELVSLHSLIIIIPNIKVKVTGYFSKRIWCLDGVSSGLLNSGIC